MVRESFEYFLVDHPHGGALQREIRLILTSIKNKEKCI
jgi:hypothetical protein